MTRKALPLVTALAISCLALSARAQSPGQFTVYALVTVDRLSGIQSSPLLKTLSPGPCASGTVSTPGSPCTAWNNNVNPIGFTGGATYTFKVLGPATLAVDLRGSLMSDKRGAQTASDGSGTRIYSGLGGLRASFHTPIRLFLPYVEGAVGYARSNYGILTNNQVSSNPLYPGIPTQNNLEYHGLAGLDLRLTPLLDFRLAEGGIGAFQSMGTYSHTYPIYSISTGVVFHIPPRD
jgi:hypothetical protein